MWAVLCQTQVPLLLDSCDFYALEVEVPVPMAELRAATRSVRDEVARILDHV